MKKQNKYKKKKNKKTLPALNIFGLIPKYAGIITLLVILTVIANGLSIAVPKLIANAIDSYTNGNFFITNLIIKFSVIAVLIFIFTYLQNIIQVLASERVARDMRNDITSKISLQPYSYIEKITPSRLLTNLTSDVDAVKIFVSTAISSIISSIFLIIGVSVLLLITDWRLALVVLSITPIIGLSFFFVLKKVRKLFTRSQEAIDWLNKVISGSILGSSLIRLLNSQRYESKKFLLANTETRDIGFAILRLFSGLIPIITFFTNLAILAIVLLGGHFVIIEEMSLGSFTAFNTYLAILIFPILILGFISNLIAQAEASYVRILKVLNAPIEKNTGKNKAILQGNIEVKNVSMNFEEKMALKNISLSIKAGSKTAIIGPTAAGKTQLLYLLIGLLTPTKGTVSFDGKNINEYDKENLHSQVGFVFQDSSMFNLSLKENIAFNNSSAEKHTTKAIETAELKNYIETLPQKLDTVVSERGTSLSGGQKQRIMLARALALNPKILLLDDFTARVDTNTERKILSNIAKNYPETTLISVTQKISSIEHYDQIILIMKGELIAKGTHEELLNSSPEYVQIFQSQRSTSQYEITDEK